VLLIRWGGMQDELPANLRGAADMLAGRLQFRTGLIVQVVPPLIFVMVGVLIISFYGMVGITLAYFIRAFS